MWQTGTGAVTALIRTLTGTYQYAAGTSGTVAITGSVLTMGCYAASGTSATCVLNGGSSISSSAHRAGRSRLSYPIGNLTNPSYVFTNTTGYFIEYLVS